MRLRAVTSGRLALVAALVAAFAVALVVAPSGALMVSPAIALIVLLALGLFPSAELIARLARRLRRPRRAADLHQRRPAEPSLGRGVAVLPFALAVRPPPALALLA